VKGQIGVADASTLSSKLIEFADSHDKRLPKDWEEYVIWVSQKHDGALLKSLESRYELVWGEKAECFSPAKALIHAKKRHLQSDAHYIDGRIKAGLSKFSVSQSAVQPVGESRKVDK
jgi:hypothetical protein